MLLCANVLDFFVGYLVRLLHRSSEYYGISNMEERNGWNRD